MDFFSVGKECSGGRIGHKCPAVDANKGKGSQTPQGEMKLQRWTGLRQRPQNGAVCTNTGQTENSVKSRISQGEMETEAESERCAGASPRTTLGRKGPTICRARHVEDSSRCPRDVVSFPCGSVP